MGNIQMIDFISSLSITMFIVLSKIAIKWLQIMINNEFFWWMEWIEKYYYKERFNNDANECKFPQIWVLNDFFLQFYESNFL